MKQMIRSGFIKLSVTNLEPHLFDLQTTMSHSHKILKFLPPRLHCVSAQIICFVISFARVIVTFQAYQKAFYKTEEACQGLYRIPFTYLLRSISSVEYNEVVLYICVLHLHEYTFHEHKFLMAVILPTLLSKQKISYHYYLMDLPQVINSQQTGIRPGQTSENRGRKPSSLSSLRTSM